MLCMSRTYLLTLVHVFSRASSFNTSNCCMVSSILALSPITICIFFFNSASFFSTLDTNVSITRKISRGMKGNARIDHVHDFRIDLLLHSLLQLLQLPGPFFSLRNINLVPVVNATLFPELSSRRPLRVEYAICWRQTHRFSS